MMNFGIAVLFAAAVLGCSPKEGDDAVTEAPAPARAAESNWNLVLITLDTTRADALGAYGQTLDTTPHIDRMAAEGILFEQAVTAAPHTLAAHATIFTGLLPYTHGVRSNQGYVLSPRNETLAEVLSGHGYRTGAEIASKVLRRSTRITQGFESVRDTDSPGIQLKLGVQLPNGKHAKTTERTGADITDHGIKFIRNYRDEKFFLWLHYFDAHNPYEAPLQFKNKFPENDYLAEVASLDDQVGRVVEEIRYLGLRDRTLVVVTSDHGEGLGDHGESTHSFFVYESTMRVPLIVWGPASLPSGRRVEGLVRTVDLLPTLLDWLELPPAQGVQGRSLRALVDGDEQDLGLVAYGEAVDLFRIFGTTPLRSLRDDQWKYIHKVEPELYDLKSDPAELENLAPTRADVVVRLRDQLRARLAERTAMPPDATVTISADAQRELTALGYLAPAAGTRLPDELSLLEEFGEDPATLIEDLTKISTSKGLLMSHQWEKAAERLRPLLEKHPRSGHVAGLMARALSGSGDTEAAIALFRKASDLEPHVDSHVRRLTVILNKADRSRESVEAFFAFLEQNPCGDLRSSLNRLLHQQQRYREQIAALADGAASCPDSGNDLNNYAWALATSPDETLRDGELAVEFAQRAITNSDGEPTPNYLDTLAAAYAQTGNFEAAIRETQRAVKILERNGARRSMLFAYQRRLAEFEARYPVRD